MSKPNIYKWTTKRVTGKNGTSVPKHEKVPMTSREVKAFIMKQHGWTSEQYIKQRDIFKNKLRAKEMFEEASGIKVEKQSPVELMYKEAKAMQKYGPEYRESLQMQRIKSFSSISMGKRGREALKHEEYLKHRRITYLKYSNVAFMNMVKQMPQAQKIVREIQDPVKREEALNELSKKLKMAKDEIGKRTGKSAIPTGEKVGSPDLITDADVDDIIDDYK